MHPTPPSPPDPRHLQPVRVLLLPGWQNSGSGHWQTLWEERHGDERVPQADWFWPRRGDWMAQLETAVLASPLPVLLAAHSLGCHLVAAWAAHSRQTGRALGALLVAPPDLARPLLPPQLRSWQPPVLQRLPFPARLVSSNDDPYAGSSASRAMAEAWGASITELDAAGHLNADSALEDWPRARKWLLELPGGDGHCSSG